MHGENGIGGTDKLSVAAARRSTKVGGGAHKFAARRGRRTALESPQ